MILGDNYFYWAKILCFSQYIFAFFEAFYSFT